ncbi:ubiquitin-conjugating enzyme [Colletotrichum gloeosporioides Cg-14]|uniref:Ubiquitin-conjugating enzyme n=1 Tax=Colletotrichum gloeosporioides (strain Cg-14) TaxID=1237896 RepID=T0LRV9_COLGC|nr:ubiquitin-conjugating enzyme [Colletotrichum gloeosporioides Cg-14]
MATPKFNSKSPTIRRILREAQELSNSPSPDYTATPLETDLFEWHFTFRGPPNSSYSDGIYHGRIVLPPTYPLRPPSFRFLTPSGRFETNREICLSISGHHEETWQPAWGVRTALVALRSFMETDPRGQLGGLETSDAECEESAKSIAVTSEPSDVEIPSELKMGWKDEMGKPAERQLHAQETPRHDDGDAESAELAEGFVRTAPEVGGPETSQVPKSQVPAPDIAARTSNGPSPSILTPTRTVSLPPAPNVRQAHQRPHDEGVPLWVDRAIVALVVLLLAMILKVVLDF